MTILSDKRTGVAIIAAVKAARAAGIAVVPPRQDGSKAPVSEWKRYQSEPPPPAQLNAWYAGGQLTGIGYVTGKVSGIECFEFDDANVHEAFRETARRVGYGDLIDRIEQGYSDRSINGVHWYYRCEEITGNTALAKRPLPGSSTNGKATIETRGEGGYVIAAPSSGAVHPSGKPYVALYGCPATITTITTEERAALFQLARSHDEMPVPEAAPSSSRTDGTRVGDVFNERATWAETLEPHGWEHLFERDGIHYWRRPGKQHGISATTNWDGSDCLRVFTSSTVLEAKMYRKFTAYTALNHNGDPKAAARELAEKGYKPDDDNGPQAKFGGKQAGGNESGDAGDAGEWETVPPDSEQRTRPTLHPAALHGLAGNIVRAAMESTEGDPVGILTFFLVAFGNAAGPSAFHRVGDDEHGTALFAVIVGDSAKDRKGHSRTTPLRLMKHADPEWYGRVVKGLSSGEGLIWTVRDPIEKTGKDGSIEIIDEGVRDKRLLAVEPEFGRVLSTKERSGNTLTAIMRDAWDRGQTLGALTKTPYKATGAHISIYGNITESDLRENMTGVDIMNGFANRITWFVVTRARVAARLPIMADEEFFDLVGRIQSALAFARTAGEIDFTAEAWPIWEQAYARFAQRSSGLVESLTARGDPITLRLALIYALLDECDAIHPVHLKAALAVWSHAHASVQYLFGTLTGNPIADRILALLRDSIEMTQTEISNALGTHVKAAAMASAIHHLKQTGRIVEERLRPAGGTGRTATRYRLPTPTGSRKAA